MGFYSHKQYICPFFKGDDRLCVRCEGGKVNFRDRRAAKEFTDNFCASMAGWKICSLASSLLAYYERTETKKGEE